MGVKYPQQDEAPRYPLTRLFDGDPKTAWVYSATSREFYTNFWKSRYGLRLRPDKPVTLDSICIVNGQNLSPARFMANHRAKLVKITLSTGNIQHVYMRSLKDQQGWQTLRFPRFQAEAITLEFSQITRSPSKGADFCLSEIELRNDGRKIDLKMPKLVMYGDGLEGDAGALLLIRRDGFPVNGIPMDTGDQEDWSPSGRYVAGMNNKPQLWTYDAIRGIKISKKSPPPMSQSDGKWFRRIIRDN